MSKCWRVAEAWISTTDTTISLTLGDIIVVLDSDGDPEWWYGYPVSLRPILLAISSHHSDMTCATCL
jgi:hypothetical protein